MSTVNGDILITSLSINTGHPDCQKSYRSEVQAMLAGKIYLSHI